MYIHRGYNEGGLYPLRVSSATAPPPLTPAAFQVLLALAGGAGHGYGVMTFVEQTSGGTVRLGPGTLYRTLARLVADGLVTETEGADPEAPHDARRRYYELTALGREAVRREAELLSAFVEAARTAGLLGARRCA